MRGRRKRERVKNVGAALIVIAFFAGIDVLPISPISFASGQTVTSPSDNASIKDDDPDPPPATVGIGKLQPICPTTTTTTSGGSGNTDGGYDDDDAQERGCEVREMLVSAMESDDQLQGKLLRAWCAISSKKRSMQVSSRKMEFRRLTVCDRRVCVSR